MCVCAHNIILFVCMYAYYVCVQYMYECLLEVAKYITKYIRVVFKRFLKLVVEQSPSVLTI